MTKAGTHRYVTGMLVLVGICTAGQLTSAWGFVVTDAATTARNAITAALKSRILDTVASEYDRLQRMAARLSAQTDLAKYATVNAPAWRMPDGDPDGLVRALQSGDPSGAAYARATRPRESVDGVFDGLSPAARDALERELATLDIADSTIIAGVHQTGMLRARGDRELQTIDQLEADVINASPEHGTTAVLDTISAASLIEARQKQARLQFLTSIAEQLLVDEKRARDAEAATLNMQLNRLKTQSDSEEGGDPLLAGAADDLRTWRQP